MADECSGGYCRIGRIILAEQLNMDFTSVHNHQERSVFDAVLKAAPGFPGVCNDPDLLLDVACVALNRLPPRYIRHSVDYLFYLTEHERTEQERQLNAAVSSAFHFVQARTAVGAR